IRSGRSRKRRDPCMTPQPMPVARPLQPGGILTREESREHSPDARRKGETMDDFGLPVAPAGSAIKKAAIRRAVKKAAVKKAVRRALLKRAVKKRAVKKAVAKRAVRKAARGRGAGSAVRKRAGKKAVRRRVRKAVRKEK